MICSLLTLACGAREEQGVIGVENASGRTGVYFIPSGSRSQSVPLLIILHGSGGSGTDMIPFFQGLASRRRFAVLAPDSRHLEVGLTWEVGDKPGDVTPDLEHVLNCVEWLGREKHVDIDSAHVLIAGFSAGGSNAPYIASNRPGFTHAAVLHGGVFPGGIGPRRMPVWFSTGEQDRYRSVALVQAAAASLSALGFNDVTFHSYPERHDLGEAELRDLIDWWLGP